YSAPPTDTSDAVLALAIKTGRIVWSRQFTPSDIFNGGCADKTVNCPDGGGPDYDFGSSVMLVRSGGRPLIIAGQKSGIVYALDPDRRGEIVWQIRVGKGSTNGGVQWGMAADGQNVYAAVSDLVRTTRRNREATDLRASDLDPNQGGGLTAIKISDGSK